MKQEECYRCRQPSPDYLTCGECLEFSAVSKAQGVVLYKGIAKDLVWRLKSSGAKSAVHAMANYMLSAMEDIDLIIPAPTASSRVRQRGYDQSLLLARQLSRTSGVPWASCLVRNGQAHQVGSDKELRLWQLQDAFRVRKASLLRNARILLVDDVITTGATIESVALVLKEAGATRVEALAFARPTLKIKNT
jgi:ComF family protein